MKPTSFGLRIILYLGALILSACQPVEQNRAIQAPQVASVRSSYTGPRSTIMVGKFENRSNYMRGIFSDGTDRLGGQTKSIVITHLQQTGRFNVVDRDNMETLANEAAIAGSSQSLRGANYAIVGSVSEFGRKEVGDRELYGILGSGKKQIAYAKVNLNVVDVLTSEVVHSALGAGEFSLSNREMIGFGSTASYDSTLTGKVLDLAIREAIDTLVGAIESGAWTP